MSAKHEYASRLSWEGNLGEGTATYQGYGRQWRARIEGKPDITGTADAAYRGARDLPNPEDLLLVSLSSCHMLTYLALCARKGISVLSYEDEVSGVMATRADGGGSFESVTLSPRVEISDPSRTELAMSLHEDAQALCFIAQSVNFPVHHSPTVRARS